MMSITRVAGPWGDWRRRMRGELVWILLAKLAALTLLWLLFFSAAHRQPVDAGSVGLRLGVAPAAVSAPSSTSTPLRKEISRG